MEDSFRCERMPRGIDSKVKEKQEMASARRWLASTAILARMRETFCSWMSGKVCRTF